VILLSFLEPGVPAGSSRIAEYVEAGRGGQWSACAVRNVLLRLEAC
jgi:hypothetical protein